MKYYTRYPAHGRRQRKKLCLPSSWNIRLNCKHRRERRANLSGLKLSPRPPRSAKNTYARNKGIRRLSHVYLCIAWPWLSPPQESAGAKHGEPAGAGAPREGSQRAPIGRRAYSGSLLGISAAALVDGLPGPAARRPRRRRSDKSRYAELCPGAYNLFTNYARR